MNKFATLIAAVFLALVAIAVMLGILALIVVSKGVAFLLFLFCILTWAAYDFLRSRKYG